MMTASGWSANQFSALLGVYRSDLGMSASATTGLFALYVLGLVPALLVGGPLADRYGRRPVALVALAVNLFSSLLLMAGAHWTAVLFPGRFLTGVGAGALLAAGGAWVKELSSPPYGAAGGAAKRSGLFVSLGFASGGLVASVLAQWAPDPLVTAYLPHVLLALLAWLGARHAPETRPRREVLPLPGRSPDAWRVVRGRFLRRFLAFAPWVFAAPTIGFATLPGLVDGHLRGWQTVYGGIATAVVPLAGMLAQRAVGRLAAWHRIAPGAVGLALSALGFALAACAAAAADPVLGLLAGAVLGAGYGLALAFGLTEVTRVAPPEHLARLTALLWTLAYLGMFAPYLVALLSVAVPVPVLLTALAALALVCCAAFTAREGRARGALGT